MHRLVTDARFIAKVKAEYLESEWGRAVMGERYEFITEVEAMNSKDVSRGIEIQAKAHESHQRKVAEGLERQAGVLETMRDGQREIRETMAAVLEDMEEMEARTLYGTGRRRLPVGLGRAEKAALCSAAYSLLESSDTPRTRRGPTS